MIFGLLIMTYLTGDLTLEKTVTLNVDPSFRKRISLQVDTKGHIYYHDYWEHRVYKLDSHGDVLFEFGRPGAGPGEHHKPLELCLLEEQSLLVVGEAYGEITAFDLETGQYVKTVHRFFPGFPLLKWDEGFIFCGGGMGSADGKKGKMARVLDLNGRLVNEWMVGPGWDANAVHSNSPSFTVSDNQVVYFSEGANRQIWVCAPFEDDFEVWDLTIPLHYIEPPKRPFNPSQYFDKEKAQAYFKSFTQIAQIGYLEGGVLAICWQINDPYPYSLDIVDIESRRHIISNRVMKGRLALCANQRAYTLELIEDEDVLSDSPAKHVLRVFRFTR